MDEGTGLEAIRTARSRGESGPEGREGRPGAVASPLVYRTGDVVQILGISRRQLQYWAQTDLIVPSEKTPGGHHRYTFEDLVALKATKRLIDAGVSVQRIRSSIQALRRMLPRVERPLSELTLVATGDVVLVFHEGSAFEAVTGQEWVFQVAQFEREIAAWRRRHASPDGVSAGAGAGLAGGRDAGAAGSAVAEPAARPVPTSEGGTA
jgi:DNA-binding transcriptional MerR regulator